MEFLLPFDSTDYPFPPSHSGRWAPRPLLAQSGLHHPLKAPSALSATHLLMQLVGASLGGSTSLSCPHPWKGQPWRNDHCSEERRAMVSPGGWLVPSEDELVVAFDPNKEGQGEGTGGLGPSSGSALSLHVAQTRPFSRGL